ncbi:MAG TPA: hypothetical protein H9787_07110 [Candidatus Oscillibacter excrementigallinarum]|uniref:Uncharacterized protein n=1 Tax=Candidatus Oscillibacter excrementigallinarum TaxID=2838716 RepID=A0A9D2RRX6_9FIRM|nr:hypothetical protein [Candidatus Oscillibacter excrementigallinarum]
MQSKTSCFNGTLFRKNLTRFWPLWGLASFIGALFPLAVLLDMVHRGRTAFTAAQFTQMYYEVVSAVPVIDLVYAALCAMAVWSYLYNARSVGLMHTLPIRREGLFLTNFLSGFSMTLIPYAVTGTLCVIVSLCGGAFDAKGLAVTVLAVLGESFFYFSSATFVAFITGNAFAMPPLYALLHFLAVLLDWLISSFAQGFIFGFSTSYTGVVEWLSPTVYLVSRVHPDGQYTEVQQTLADGTSYTDRVLTSVDLENFWLVGVYALVGLVLAALALLLYRRRRSETAGDVVAVGWLRPVFRYGVAGLCALLGGQLLYSLFWYGFQQGNYYDTLPMVVCLLAAGTIGYYGASMLLAKSLKVFRGSWKGLAVVLAGCALVCCVLHFDLLGVADRVPEAGQLQTLEVRTADNSYTLTPEQDGDLVEQVRTLHQAVVADEAYIREMESLQYSTLSEDEDPDTTFTGLSLTYVLKSGARVDRWYHLPITRDRLAQPGTYDHLLDQFVNSDTVKARRLHLNDSRWTPDGGSLYVEARNEGYDLGSREAASILEAVGRDLDAGHWGEYDWFDVDNNGDYALSLDLSFAELDDSGRDWISINISPEMAETVDCLQALGLVTDADLVTWHELYAESYTQDYEDAVYDTSGGETVAVFGAAGSAAVSPA